jgi:hypothetical protein
LRTKYPTLIKFYKKEGVHPSYRMVQKGLVFLGWTAVFAALQPVAVLRVCIVLKHAYSTDTLQFLYISLNTCYILLHLELEDELSILVSRDRATHYKNLELGASQEQWAVFKPRQVTSQDGLGNVFYFFRSSRRSSFSLLSLTLYSTPNSLSW